MDYQKEFPIVFSMSDHGEGFLLRAPSFVFDYDILEKNSFLSDFIESADKDKIPQKAGIYTATVKPVLVEYGWHMSVNQEIELRILDVNEVYTIPELIETE